MNKKNIQAMKYAFRMTFCQDAMPIILLLMCILMTTFLVFNGFTFGWLFIPLFFLVFIGRFMQKYFDWFIICNDDSVVYPWEML